MFNTKSKERSVNLDYGTDKFTHYGSRHTPRASTCVPSICLGRLPWKDETTDRLFIIGHSPTTYFLSSISHGSIRDTERHLDTHSSNNPLIVQSTF